MALKIYIAYNIFQYTVQHIPVEMRMPFRVPILYKVTEDPIAFHQTILLKIDTSL